MNVNKCALYSDNTFDVHLQDVFNVISHLQSARTIPDLATFVFFTHRRSFRKLGCWVKEFTERWGSTSPFSIIKTYLHTIMSFSYLWTKSFDVLLSEAEYRHVKAFVEAQDTTDMNQGKCRYRIDPSNIEQWITLFKYLWDQLEGLLLERIPSQSDTPPTQYQVKSTAPDEVSTQRLTLVIACLYSLRHIFNHLFSIPAPQFQRALTVAGMS